MQQELFNLNHIYFDVDCKTQKEAFTFIANAFVENDVSNNLKKCFKGLVKREKEGTTGFNDGIAIPHARIKEISRPGLFVFLFKDGIEWKSIDDSKVKLAIALAIPETNSGSEHIKILSSVARKLVDQEFCQNLLSAKSKEAVYKLISEIEIK
ncbi:PTS sugar transporter subunit IIA [Spiroplasma chrysopicola]|uniref:PTS system fructose-specific IIA component n=1 Tax=Spiroplasma chrysopicola DF-1 TaxID=1276227 RepID=R4UGV8_9MOLU|nr:PTS sugar transporter subunit IIA [Spiroplasma chrysopicola]AGM25390.1 PTS system fructose-specific IIA component [Spiroplasma chrysopicola DF-1]